MMLFTFLNSNLCLLAVFFIGVFLQCFGSGPSLIELNEKTIPRNDKKNSLQFFSFIKKNIGCSLLFCTQLHSCCFEMATILCKDNVFKMQSDRFEIFKSQDPEKGNFDVKFMVQDKIIYAHRIFLTPVSETLDAWLSDRWSTKDEPIKIQTYSYDGFYQFLCFIYIGECELTNWSIFQMVDMAEFYGVPSLKDYCDYFLTKMKLDAENIERYYEFCQTYSLPLLTQSIKKFILENGSKIILSKNLITFKMPFFKFFISLLKWYSEQEIFQAVYIWIEHRVMEKAKDMNDKNVSIQETIKAELYTIIPEPKFGTMKFEFLMNSVVENGFILSPTELHKFFLHCRDRRLSNERAFRWVYELAEKQALKKQAMPSDDDNFNIADSIKADLAEVLPHARFYVMDKQFLINFVFEKGFLLSPHGMLLAYNNMLGWAGERFKNIYEIAEKQALQKQRMSSEGETFNVADSIKTDLAEVIPHVKFFWMEKQFLMDFVVEKGFFLSPAEFYRIFNYNKYEDEKQKFKDVYEIAEKQALKKQIIAAQNNEYFNVADSIKVDLAEVMPHVTITNKIYEFLFERGFISFPMFLLYCAFLLNKSR